MSEQYSSMATFQDARTRLGVLLKQLANIADERGDMVIDNQNVLVKTAEIGRNVSRPLSEILAERAQNVLDKNSFRVAVIGEFNTGKSTLINTLLGRDILSTSIKPKTATKTVLRYGSTDAYRVTYNKEYASLNSDEIIVSNNLKEDIVEVTSDNADALLLKKKSESVASRISEVEIWCDSDFLDREETEIVDTPGLGSVIDAHKLVTYRLIPEMDATLYLFPSDPGLADTDKDVLGFIRQHISQILFVMTKSDRLLQSEIADMVAYSQDVLQSVAEIPVKRVYAVSARYEKEGNSNESGFSIFLEDLESFLISSKGVARLQAPLELAKTKHEYLVKNTRVDQRRINDDVETLEKELSHLRDTQSIIEEEKRTLIESVEKRIDEFTSSALDGIEQLPQLIEISVFKALDSFNKDSLKRADAKLQPIIGNTVDEWTKIKEKSFRLQVKSLQERIESELKRYVELVDNATKYQMSRESLDYESDLDLSTVASGRGGRLVWDTTKKAGGALVTGVGAVGIASAVASIATGAFVVFPPFLILLPPLLPVLKHLAQGENRIREDIKRQLKKNIPNNDVTIFEAVVKGYKKDGETQPGIEEKLRGHFDTWGSTIIDEINEFVANLIDNQLSQLTKQISEKENNTFNREERRKMHSTHIENLEKVLAQILELEALIENMKIGK